MTIIDRLLRACATGEGCRATINAKVLDNLNHDLWPDIAQADVYDRRPTMTEPRLLEARSRAERRFTALRRRCLSWSSWAWPWSLSASACRSNALRPKGRSNLCPGCC